MELTDEYSQSSLNKAANFLGVNELNSLDYKSLNSIRKLSKKFGCMEYDLIKSLNIGDTSPTQSSKVEVESVKIENENSLHGSTEKLDSKIVDKKKNSSELSANSILNNSVNRFQNSIDSLYKRTSIIRKKSRKNKKSSTKDKKISNNSDIVLISHNKINEFSTIPENIDSLNVDDTKLRHVVLEKDENFGFGFIAGSEKPLVIRFVSPNGPGHKKLLNGDEIVTINGENVQYASRDHVIEMIKNTGSKLEMTVKQPTPISENSVLLTEEKKATKKIRKNKVRFKLENESSSKDDNQQPLEVLEQKVDINIVPDNNSNLYETCEFFNKSSIEYIEQQQPVHYVSMDCLEYHNPNNNGNIFKVHLENNMIKSFKYDINTCVKDVLGCLKEKLNLKYIDYFGLCIKLNTSCLNSMSSRQMILLDETQLLFDIVREYRNMEFSFRFLFIPNNLEILMYKDVNAFYYLYEQTCNDVHSEVYGNEINYDFLLQLVASNILHDYISPSTLPISSSHLNLNTSKSAKSIYKHIDNEISLEKLIPKSIIHSPFIKPKELKKQIIHKVEILYKTHSLNKDEIKLDYLNCIQNQVQQFSTRVFLATLLDKKEEVMIAIGSECGISVYADFKTKNLKNLVTFESIENINVSWHSQNLICIHLDLVCENNLEKAVVLGLLKEDYLTFLYLLQGYLRVFVYPLKNSLCPINETQSSNFENLNIPAYLVKHPQIDVLSRSNSVSDLHNNVDSLKYSNNDNQLKYFIEQSNESYFKNAVSIPNTATAVSYKESIQNKDTDKSKYDQIVKLKNVIKAKSCSTNDVNNSLKRTLHSELIERIKQRVNMVKEDESVYTIFNENIDDYVRNVKYDEFKNKKINNKETNIIDTASYIDDTTEESITDHSDTADSNIFAYGYNSTSNNETNHKNTKDDMYNFINIPKSPQNKYESSISQSVDNIYLYNIKV